MKLYLSSYKLGNAHSRLRALASGRTIGLIPNAVDYLEPQKKAASNAAAMEEVRSLGIDVHQVDLQPFFGRPHEMKAKFAELGGVWVRGGNTFVLRQAMSLSGLDSLISHTTEPGFLYGGYSAGVCVLAPTLKGLQQVDDPTVLPYANSEPIWQGLGILTYLILPHYRSNHHESETIEMEVEYCQAHGIPFRTLRDGQVLIGDSSDTSALELHE